MADLQKEIDALDRVLFRLASVDDDRLLTVLDALLPQLLELFPATTALPLEFQLKDKILQVIAHVKTRLHGIAAPRLPLLKLCAVVDDPRSPFATSFAFMFIEMGFPAATAEDQTSVLERLIKPLGNVSSATQETFFRLLLRTFPATTGAASRLLATAESATADIVLDFLLDLVVFQPPATPESVVYGLLPPRVDRLKRVKVTELKREALYDCQLHALQFVKSLGATHATRVLHFVAGASSFHHVIKSFCEDQLQRVRQEDSAALENAVVCRDLMALVMSSHVLVQGGTPLAGRDALLLGNRRRLGDASILAAAGLLKHSKAAPNVVPLVLQVICQLMFADEPSRAQNVRHRIKIAGAQLCEWTFHHASEPIVAQLLGPVLLPTLLRTVMDPNADLDHANAAFWREFRQHMYEAISVLCRRTPSLMTGSEQAFQVLLVRCLVEEQHRAGVNALKAMNALREAFDACKDTAPAVLLKIQSELKGLLQGTKLYDAASNYQRVRAVVGEWVETIIARSTSAADLRFALFKMCGDDDEGVRRTATKALYTKPWPSAETLVRTLQSLPGVKDSSSLQRAMSPREAQQCLLFLQAVMNDARDEKEEVWRRDVLKIFVETLLQPPDVAAASKRDLASLLSSVAGQLIQLHGDSASLIDTLLSGRARDVAATFPRAASISSREALLSLSTILGWSVNADGGDIGGIVDSALATLADTSPPAPADSCAALYKVGTIGSVLVRDDTSQHSALTLRALTNLTTALGRSVESVSKFGSLPRGDEALNELFDRLRSCIDAVGLTGNWNQLLLGSEEASAPLRKLRGDSIAQLRTIIEWKLEAVSADGSVKSRLGAIRAVALEAVANATRESVWPVKNSSDFELLVSSILKLGSDQECELQFCIAHTLVAMGTSIVGSNDMPVATRLVLRLIKDGAEARQVPMRRSATVWLLCLCAAGLSSSSLPIWSQTFTSTAFADTLVSMHEFFVTMLNDADPVTTECAVKGLAYLRLKAPSSEIGDLFSDSLFRRLRCFRVFAPAAATPNARDRDADQDDDVDTQPAAADAAPATREGSTPASSDTVENVAYREVSNVAADIGDPELMYSLLYLSTTNPIWEALSVARTHASLASAFSFPAVDRAFRAGIIQQANEQWMSEAYAHRSKLIPWLFLLKHHANSKVAEVMGNLWNFAKGELMVSTSQEKSLLSQQWGTILNFLLTKLEHSRNFKYREACCLALIDLLNGADAAAIEASFLRLWKLTSRSVDDIMEAVAVAGLKLFKALGELSLRVAVEHEGCRRELLDYLISQGMTTKNVVCRALCIDLLLRLVKEIEAEALDDRLGALILKLLEYLSSLEMPELQYAQFHVGDKKDQLERLRVSMSQSGPVGQLLDQCMIKLKALALDSNARCVQIVDELARGVTNLLKFGVGLNTRVGTANFVATLATELPFELRKCGGAELILSRALVLYVADRSASENDHYGDEDARYETSTGVADGLVLQSYLRAAAYVCPLAEPSSVKNYVRAGVFAVHRRTIAAEETKSASATASDSEGFADGDTYTSRFLMVSALATKELITKCPPLTDATTVVSPDARNDWYAADVFPAAFIGQYASSQALRSVWEAVLEELPPRITYAESALEATLSVLARWIRHPSWDTRRQGVKALQALFAKGSSYQTKITTRQTDQIWNELLAAVPGRLWRGKGVILEALVAIASVRVDESQPLAALLVQESDRAWKNHEMEYLESALVGLGTLASAMPSTVPFESLRLDLVRDVRSRLQLWHTEAATEEENSTTTAKALPPMMVKVVFEALAALFPPAITTEEGTTWTREILQWLDACLLDASFHVWSVRRSVFNTMASVVRRAPVDAFKSHTTITRLVERSCGDVGVGDAKYSMIRVAAGDVLVALASRHTEPAIAIQLTTHRERLSTAVDVLRGSEEPKEQQIAAQIFTQLANSVAA